MKKCIFCFFLKTYWPAFVYWAGVVIVCFAINIECGLFRHEVKKSIQCELKTLFF